MILNILMAESKDELKSLFMRVKEESEKAGLKLNTLKTKIKASSPIISRQIDGEKEKTVPDFIFLVSKIIVDGDCTIVVIWIIKTFFYIILLYILTTSS